MYVSRERGAFTGGSEGMPRLGPSTFAWLLVVICFMTPILCAVNTITHSPGRPVQGKLDGIGSLILI